MPLFKAVSKLVQKPTTSASHVDTKDTGVTNAGLDTGPSKEGQVHTEIITTPNKPSWIAQRPVQNRVESDQSYLSTEDEQCVLQVPVDQKGEFVCGDISGSSKLPVQSCQVRGRLKQHIQFWETIEAPEFILNTIRKGYTVLPNYIAISLAMRSMSY